MLSTTQGVITVGQQKGRKASCLTNLWEQGHRSGLLPLSTKLSISVHKKNHPASQVQTVRSKHLPVTHKTSQVCLSAYTKVHERKEHISFFYNNILLTLVVLNNSVSQIIIKPWKFIHRTFPKGVDWVTIIHPPILLYIFPTQVNITEWQLVEQDYFTDNLESALVF